MKRAATFISVVRVFLEGLRVLSSFSLRPVFSKFCIVWHHLYYKRVCVFYSIRKKGQIDNVE